jgi:hypothetical protein
MDTVSPLEIAHKRVADIAEQIASNKNKIADAQAIINGLEIEAAELDQWIAGWHKLMGTTPKATAAERIVLNPPQRTRRPKNPDREDVVNQSLQIIRERGTPQPRKELFDALAMRDIKIQGKDPEMVLSTMLWRSQDKIVRLPNHGYWPKDTDYDPAIYIAEFDDVIGAADSSPEGGELADDADD